MAKYNYVTCEEVVSQYDDYDLKEQRIVPARYVEAKLAIDTGNPYIEALPYPRTGSYRHIAKLWPILITIR